MKKVCLFFLIVMILISCSGSDSNNASSVNNGPYPYYDIHLPQKISLASPDSPSLNLTYDLAYDSRHRLSSIQVSGAMTANYSYTYEEFVLKTVTVNGSDVSTILYDGAGRLSGVLHNGSTTAITYDGTTNNYFYGSRIFKANDEKDIYLMDANTANPVFFTDTMLGPFYNVLGYHGFAALLTDENLYYLCNRRPRPYFKNPLTGELATCAYSQSSNEYFLGGPVGWSDQTRVYIEYTYVKDYQYENIPQL